MKKISLKSALVLVSQALFASPAFSAMTPLAIGILPPVQFPQEDVTVTGARVDLFWGEHRNVYGFDLGAIGNVTSQNFGGLLQLAGLFNYNEGETTVIGAQVAAITNVDINKTHIYGLQASLFNSNAGEALVVGLDLGLLANLTPHTDIWGAQVGIYNSAYEVYGFQIGLVNMAEKLHGIQIGLVNINRQGLFTVCPVLNIGF